MRLGQQEDSRIVVYAARQLVRLGWDKNDQPGRELLVRLLRQQTGREFGFVFGEQGQLEQKPVIQQWINWIQKKYPEQAASVFRDAKINEWTARMLTNIDWESGDAARGLKLYRELSCSKCHNGARSSGPPLTGITRRFNRRDLFNTITQPDEQVSSRYRTVIIETTSGEVYKGLVVYESVDGITLMNGDNETIRIENSEIEFRQTSLTSLMPAGLLDRTQPSDWADLYEYLRTLK
jgi:putative heme-binding domain-containing protein